MANSDQAVRDLLTYPKAFLENNGLIIYSGGGDSRAVDFRMVMTEDQWDSITGDSPRKVPCWALYFDGGYCAKAKSGETPSAKIPAHYVKMVGRDEASWGRGAAGYVLPAKTGSDVMFTSKLNGCTFGVGSSAGGARLVTHHQPMGGAASSAGNLSGLSQAVDRSITQGGGTALAKATSTGSENATVIGLRQKSQWHFYIQRFKVSSSSRPLLEGVAVIK